MQIHVAKAKQVVLAKVAAGVKVEAAMASVGRALETWRDWRKTDPVFKAKADRIRADLKRGIRARSQVPDFPDFSEQFLGYSVPEAHLRIYDVIEGRDPRDLRDSMQFQPGAWPGRYMVINIPPDHAKSTTWTVNHSVWQIAQNPNVRIGIVSKSQSMAKKFLYQIKFYLGNADLYPALHAAYAPDGGWRSNDYGDGLAWREDRIYIRGRNQPDKEPTVEALGIGSQLYGTRFDLIILDDVEDMGSAGQYEAHADWVGQEVFNRLHPEHGRLLILGTRVGVMDIYRKLRDDAKTEDGDPFYTYFAQPAVIANDTGHSDEWETLWPERLDPKKIARSRAAMTDPRRFQFVYQQRDVSDNATFPQEAVHASVNNRRLHGPLHPGSISARAHGMNGLYVVGSWDPASSAGRNAFVVIGTDRESKHRWVMDVWNKKGAVPRETIALLKEWTKKYQVNEWRIEKNAVQQFITQLPEIRDFLSGNGCRLVEHQTTSNKWDPNMGVEGTLVPLFLSCVDDIDGRLYAKPDGHGQISLPSARYNRAVTELCEQLKSWEPDNKKIVQDLVMALWFAELGVRAYLRGGAGGQTHMKPRFAARGAVQRQFVVHAGDLVGSNN